MLVYIAGPYANGDVAVNVKNAIDAAEQIWQGGHMPYVPHLNHFWHMIHPHKAYDWYFYDSVWLSKCDAFVRIPGESPGADREVKQACFERIPVFYGVEAFLKEYDVRVKYPPPSEPPVSYGPTTRSGPGVQIATD